MTTNTRTLRSFNLQTLAIFFCIFIFLCIGCGGGGGGTGNVDADPGNKTDVTAYDPEPTLSE